MKEENCRLKKFEMETITKTGIINNSSLPNYIETNNKFEILEEENNASQGHPSPVKVHI